MGQTRRAQAAAQAPLVVADERHLPWALDSGVSGVSQLAGSQEEQQPPQQARRRLTMSLSRLS